MVCWLKTKDKHECLYAQEKTEIITPTIITEKHTVSLLFGTLDVDAALRFTVELLLHTQSTCLELLT